MAIFKALEFDGVNSLDYGIYITGEAVYNAPERAIEMVNIPGKNGALALDQGRFENIEVTYHAGCFADSQADFADKVMRFRNALASRYTYKRLTDEYHPDEYRLGLYKSGLDVDAVRYGTAGEFNIVFDCKPQRFLIDGDRAISPTEWSDVQTESGELVTIDSDGSLAVKSLEVSLEPIQDLNGYDKPWVGGAGKNKLPYPYGDGASKTTNGITYTVDANGVVTANGTATADNVFYLISSGTSALANKGIASGTYILNGAPSTSATSNYYIQLQYNGTFVSAYASGTTFTYNASGGGNDMLRIYVKSGAVLNNVKFYPMLRLASETDATFAPYSNICPISGRTSVETTRTGKNLCKPYEWVGTSSGVQFNYTENGVTLNGTATQATDIPNSYDVPQNGKFTLKAGTYKPSTDNANAGIQIVGLNPTEVLSRNGNAFTLASDRSVFARVSTYSGRVYDNLTVHLQLEAGTEATSYEPYQGTTYTTALGRTVYGGTLDVVSGVLTVDRAILTLNGSETWTHSNGTATACMRVQTRTNVGFKPNTSNASLVGDISSAFVETTPNKTWEGTIGFSVSIDANPYLHFCQTGQKNMSVEAWKTYLASNPIQVVGFLATPQTYQLTPQEVELLVGENHLWSDGEITVEYGVHPYYNPTPFESKPLIKVTGTGTLGIGEYILTITGTASQTLYIDCETMEIYTLEGTVPTGASSLVSINKNDFPMLEPGTNYISVGSGITAVTITPRWWRI